MTRCAICNRDIPDDKALEIAGTKVPPLCDRHINWVNTALKNRQDFMTKENANESPA